MDFHEYQKIQRERERRQRLPHMTNAKFDEAEAWMKKENLDNYFESEDLADAALEKFDGNSGDIWALYDMADDVWDTHYGYPLRTEERHKIEYED